MTAPHQHEKWQIRDYGDGPFCAACGDRLTPAPPTQEESWIAEYEQMIEEQEGRIDRENFDYIAALEERDDLLARIISALKERP